MLIKHHIDFSNTTAKNVASDLRKLANLAQNMHLAISQLQINES